MDLPNSPVGSAETLQQKALNTVDLMKDTVKEFVTDYCVSFNMPFIPTWPGSHDVFQDHVSTVNISTMEEPIRIKICCLHRLGVLRYVNIHNIHIVYLCCLVTICTKLRQPYTMVGIK